MATTLTNNTTFVNTRLNEQVERIEKPWDDARHWHLLWTVCERIGVFRCLEAGPQSAVSMGAQLDVNVHMLARILQLLTHTGYLKETSGGNFGFTNVPKLPGLLETWSSIERNVLDEFSDRMVAALRTCDVPFHRIYSANFVNYVCARSE